MMDITEFLEQNSPDSATRSISTMKKPRVEKVKGTLVILYIGILKCLLLECI